MACANKKDCGSNEACVEGRCQPVSATSEAQFGPQEKSFGPQEKPKVRETFATKRAEYVGEVKAETQIIKEFIALTPRMIRGG